MRDAREEGNRLYPVIDATPRLRECVSCGWIRADSSREITVDPPAGNTWGDDPHRSVLQTTLKAFICES